MRLIKLVLLFFLRLIGGLLAILQVIGLFPVLSWFKDLSSVTGSMLTVVALKLVFLVIGVTLYKGLKKPYDRLKDQKTENKEPDFSDIE